MKGETRERVGEERQNERREKRVRKETKKRVGRGREQNEKKGRQ